MRIGLFPGKPSSGGIYQYSLAMIAALDPAAAAEEGDELVLFDRSAELDSEALIRAGWSVAPVAPSPPPPSRGERARSVVREVLRKGKLLGVARKIRKPPDLGPPRDPNVVRPQPHLAAWHTSLGIELMLYPEPTTYAFEAGTPYVLAVHDLQHRLQPEFPEVSADGQAEWREYLFRNAIPRATLVLADSEVGKEDILELYGEFGVTPDRVKVLPHVPPPYLLAGKRPYEAAVAAVKRRYSLPDRYLFYPAQFWPHKNHALLVRALSQLERTRGLETAVVFSGGHTGEIRERNHREVLRLAAELGVGARVHDLGYVPDGDVAALYTGAVALAMPTFFGPTNIPVLEAWTLRCPVLTSDIRGIREQVGDAGLLADPRSVDELAGAIYRLWTDEALRRDLIERGSARIAAYTPDDFAARLREFVREAKKRVG